MLHFIPFILAGLVLAVGLCFLIEEILFITKRRRIEVLVMRTLATTDQLKARTLHLRLKAVYRLSKRRFFTVMDELHKKHKVAFRDDASSADRPLLDVRWYGLPSRNS